MRFFKLTVGIMILVLTLAILIMANNLLKNQEIAKDEKEKADQYKAAVLTVTGRSYQKSVDFLTDLKMRIENFFSAEKNEQKKRDARKWSPENEGILDN